MSFLRRVWSAISKPARFVGRDLEGNRFYEANSLNDPSRSRRTVQYYKEDAVWQYIGGGKRLPAQWSSWLSHTRPNPPTLEELQMDMARRERVLRNAQLIEAKDREESEQLARLRNAEHAALMAAPHSAKAAASAPAPNAAHSPGAAPPTAQPSSPLPEINKAQASEAEAWAPHARVRGK